MNGNDWRIPASIVAWLLGLVGILTGLIFKGMNRRIDVLKEAVVALAERTGHHDVTIAVLTGRLEHIEQSGVRIERVLEKISERQQRIRGGDDPA